MKKFRLNLSKYDVEVMVPVVKKDDNGQEIRVLEPRQQEYPMANNLNIWLRSPGMFRSAEDVAEAILLAKTLSVLGDDLGDAGSDEYIHITLDEREANVLKQCFNRLVELTADGKADVGGPMHEECILRVMRMEEVTS